MQLKVIKADGSSEQYLHTKVVGAVSNALAQADYSDIRLAEQIAEVVTYHLYNKSGSLPVTSSEIFSIIQAVLTDTDYENAAAELSDHHFRRKLKRSRIEVVPLDIRQLSDAKLLYDTDVSDRLRWDKSRIVNDLIAECSFSRQAARAVASSVEERIVNMDISLVPTSLIKQLVLNDAAAVLRAEQQFQTV
ncbi:ATP cone domain-containing protein [Planctomycetota bacterium]